MPRDASDTRQLMVEIASRLVAEEGWGGLTLRAVQAASGQRNKSAAAYHFGSREGLIEAVLVNGMTPVNERRQTMLDALDQSTSSPSLRQLADVLVRPLAECTVGVPSSSYARFLHQGSADPLLVELVGATFVAASFLTVRARLADHDDLAAVPPPLRSSRLDLAVAGLTYALSRWEAAIARHDADVLDPRGDVRLENLVDIVVAIVAAPVSPPTSDHLAAAGSVSVTPSTPRKQ